jgi:hypothetical protein
MLRLYGSKTGCFCPSESKATRIKASLSSPWERNHARSASLTVFSPYSLRQAREPDGGELMENGVKNLKGARLFPKTFCNYGFGDASSFLNHMLYKKEGRF